jgi:lipopolysaccharide export system permease protein
MTGRTSILNRYLLRETIQTWLVVTGVLLIVLVTNQFASVLGDAAANKLPRDAVAQVLVLTSVQYLTILVPVAFFLAVMLALARLYHDSEMAAMMACGIGPTQIYRALLWPTLVLAGLVGWLALQLGPAALGQVERFAAAARREASIGLLEAGRFVSFADGRAALYAGEMAPNGRLRRVFVERRTGRNVEVVIADEAWADRGPDDTRVLKFANGRRYEGEPGSQRFRFVDFADHGMPFAVPAAGPTGIRTESRPVAQLWRSADAEQRAELHWRVAVPLTLVVLTFLAVPLARTEPRKGRFTGLFTAILVYLVYVNLLAAGRGWLERGQLPAWLGLWWVHVLFIVVTLLLLLRQQGILQRWLARPA